MPWAPMPEATIHENSKLMLEEYKIRTADRLIMSSPPSYAVSAKYRDKPKLGSLVAFRADRRHDLRPLPL